MNQYHIKNQRAVSTEYFLQPIDTCPFGVKCLLLGKNGLLTIGYCREADTFWTHWAPLPDTQGETK